jgi:hypothetical protein
MTYAVISFLFGAVLGSRWRAIVLVPVSVLILAIAVGAGVSAGQTFAGTLLAGAVAIVSLQVGYLVAAVLRVALFGRRVPGMPEGQPAALQRAHKLRTP